MTAPLRRIGLTQRVDAHVQRREWRDALDQRLPALLEGIGLLPVPVPNGLADPVAWAAALGLEGLLLTGGNDVSGAAGAQDVAPARDRTERLLLHWAEAAVLPVLGICRGFQAVNLHWGGRLTPVADHVAVRHQVHDPGPPGTQGRCRMVNSFHAWAIAATDLAPVLQPIWCDAQGHVEAARHRTLPWAGLMWHPEREEPPEGADLAFMTQLFRSV